MASFCPPTSAVAIPTGLPSFIPSSTTTGKVTSPPAADEAVAVLAVVSGPHPLFLPVIITIN